MNYNNSQNIDAESFPLEFPDKLILGIEPITLCGMYNELGLGNDLNVCFLCLSCLLNVKIGNPDSFNFPNSVERIIKLEVC